MGYIENNNHNNKPLGGCNPQNLPNNRNFRLILVEGLLRLLKKQKIHRKLNSFKGKNIVAFEVKYYLKPTTYIFKDIFRNTKVPSSVY